jgi:hypothetical protein
VSEILSKTVRHRYNGGAPGKTPHQEGYHADVTIELEELDDTKAAELDMGYEVRIVHPDETPAGHPQAPEIFRFKTKAEAEDCAESFLFTLDNVKVTSSLPTTPPMLQPAEKPKKPKKAK